MTPRTAPLAAILLLALLVAAPLAGAQTRGRPVEGAYHEVYVVSGRALDVNGTPVAGGRLVVSIEQPGVRAEPVLATANCKGDFITFFNLRNVEPSGHVRVTLVGADGESNATASERFDPFWRRSDLVLQLDHEWPGRCPGTQDVFEVSVSLAARILNRTEPVEIEGDEVLAKPYTGIIRLRYILPTGQEICPPHPQQPDTCELFVVDERGDMRYSFTLDQPFPAAGHFQVILQDDTVHNVTIDPKTRLGLLYLEATGQGAPEPARTPGPGLLGLLAGAAVAAAGARRLLRGDRR